MVGILLYLPLFLHAISHSILNAYASTNPVLRLQFPLFCGLSLGDNLLDISHWYQLSW